MNPLIRQSIIQNVHNFCDNLNDVEMQELVHYFVYDVNMSDRQKPSELQSKFIDEFFDAEDWGKHLDDIDNSTFFFGASYALRTNLEFIQKILLSDVFFRYAKLLKTKAPKPKPLLSSKDKIVLTEILDEHKAMLEYQLEDEDWIRNLDEEEYELVITKQKHLKFIKKFKV